MVVSENEYCAIGKKKMLKSEGSSVTTDLFQQKEKQE